MSFITRLKLSNINNLADARYAAAAGFDYLGFCFDLEDENYIPAVKAKEIIGWIEGSYIVGEFGSQGIDELSTISSVLALDAVEVNNRLLPAELLELHIPIIKKIDIAAFTYTQLQTELEAYQQVADAFHLYSSAGQASPFVFDKLFEQFRIIWGMPVNASDVREFVQQHKPYGINISGGTEEKAGIRDFEELNHLLEQLGDDNN